MNAIVGITVEIGRRDEGFPDVVVETITGITNEDGIATTNNVEGGKRIGKVAGSALLSTTTTRLRCKAGMGSTPRMVLPDNLSLIF